MKILMPFVCACVLCASMSYHAEELDLPREETAAEQGGASLAGQLGKGYLGFVPRYGQAEDGRSGIRIIEIVPDSPAGRSGLAKNDLVIALNGVPFLFENDLEMMRSLGSVRAGTRLEMTLLRGSEVHTTELLPTVLPPERAHALANWLKIAEASNKASDNDTCMTERAGQRAFQAFKQSIPALGVELMITKDLASHEIRMSSASIAIPPDLDLSQLPLLSGLFRDLRPGDSLELLCVLGESMDELRIRPLVVPPYLLSHLTLPVNP